MKNKRIHTLLVILLTMMATFHTLSAHVEKYYYLKGSLGDKAFAIKIYCYDENNSRWATYFLATEKKDRYLKGAFKNNSWEFTAYDPRQKVNAEIKKETFAITENSDRSWTGIWFNASGDTLPVRLTPLIIDFKASKYSHLDFVHELDAYDFYRMVDVTFTRTKSDKLSNGLVCDWFKEPITGISLFRLRDAKKKLNLDSINDVLDNTHLTLVNKSLTFNFNLNATTNNINVELLFLNRGLISYDITCHPQSSAIPAETEHQLITQYISSGINVNLEDLLWFDKTTPPSTDLMKLLDYRKKIFGQTVLDILKELYPDKINSPTCNYNNLEIWQYPVWGLTKNGLYIGCTFRNITQKSCNRPDWSIVPFKKLQPFWNKNYPIK